jgi:hypothetical protein
MKKQQKRWMAAALAILMLVISICTDAGLTANAAAKKATTISIANLPENNTLYLNPGEESTYSYDFNAKKSGGVVYFEVKKDTNTAGVNSTKSGIVYPMTAGSFEIRAVAFTSSANRTKWLDARKQNGYVADPKAEKYIAAVSDWVTINVVTDKENEGLGVARSQTSLNKVLKNKKVKNVVIWTNAEREFEITSKNYKTKTLTVKAPNAEITNAGRFAQINVEQIKPSTFIEKAKGNRFNVSALNARIIIERGARILGMLYQPSIGKADISVSTSFNFSLVVRGSIDVFNIAPQREADVTEEVKPAVKIEAEENANINEVKISEASDVTVSGEKETPVNVTVEESAAGTSLTAETPVKADLNADTSVTLAENAKKSELTVSKKAEVEVKAADEDKPVEDVTVKVAKEAEGAKVSLFVNVVVEISANITLTGTAKEDSVIVVDKDVTVTDEDGNVIETDTPDSESQGSTGGDFTTPSTPNPPVSPSPDPSTPEESDFSGKVIWTVGMNRNGTITKDSPKPITIPLSRTAVSGSAIDFSLYAGEQSKYEVSADKKYLEGAETEVKVTVKSKENGRVVAEYTIIFTIEISDLPEGWPVITFEDSEIEGAGITDDINSITIKGITEMEHPDPNITVYLVNVHIPELRKFGELWYTVSVKGYKPERNLVIVDTYNGPDGPASIRPYYSAVLAEDGKQTIYINVSVTFDKYSEDSPEWDTNIIANLNGDLMITGSAITTSGTAITMRTNGPDDQKVEFTENDDGSITGEFQIEFSKNGQKYRVILDGRVYSSTSIQYIWKKNGEVIGNEDIIDPEKLEDLTVTYSVTIKLGTY